VLEPYAATWEPIQLHVDHDRLGSLANPALALLGLVLRDLGAGRIPLGYGTNRGMGDIAVDESTFAPSLAQILGPDPDARLTQAWRTYRDNPRRDDLKQDQPAAVGEGGLSA
jgi:hypothetical protein